MIDGASDTVDDGRCRERAVLTVADTLMTPLFPEFRLPLAQLFENPARVRR